MTASIVWFRNDLRLDDHEPLHRALDTGGPVNSTKLSPFLAQGSISARRVHDEVRRYEAERTTNRSTYWVIFELLWRDFFRFTADQRGNALFRPEGLRGERRAWRHDRELLERWIDGRTGDPFVDANMRELAATGYMSNRGRQNVASQLAHDLGVDWTWGAEWFGSVLIDYDVPLELGELGLRGRRGQRSARGASLRHRAAGRRVRPRRCVRAPLGGAGTTLRSGGLARTWPAP